MFHWALDVLTTAGWKVGLLASFAFCFVLLQSFRPIVERLQTSGWKVGALLRLSQFLRIAELEAARPLVVLRQFWFNVRMTFTRECVILALSPLIVIVPGLIAQKLGTGWIDLGQSDPQTWLGYVWALVVWLLFYDFFYYWWHRLQHVHWFFCASHVV